MKGKNLLFILIPLLFLVYCAPSALNYLFFFPDEKYYTDSVIQMMDKGEYLTPYQAGGEPRFKKPIITYWVLMAGYKMFGVSPASSRLLFSIAGALLVLFTYFMSRSITKNSKIATVAAFIVLANPLVLLSASRSIPDILLALFLLISAWGFLEILNKDKPPKIFYWIAYMGAALAFETKGFPAAIFAGGSILFLLFNPWKRITFRKLFDPLSVFASVFVALGWFVVMYVQHGEVFWEIFFSDQVGDRVSSRIIQVFSNGLLGVTNLVLFFIPWIVLFLGMKNHISPYYKSQPDDRKAVFVFSILWIVLIILMSGAVSKFYDRYLLPVVPLVAMVLSIFFVEVGSAFKKTTFRILLTLNIVLVLLCITYVFLVEFHWALVIGICISFVFTMFYYNKADKYAYSEVSLANAIALLYFNGFVLLYPFLLPGVGSQLVQSLHNEGCTETENVFVYGNIRTAANIRVSSCDRLNVVSMDTLYVLPEKDDHWLVIKDEDLERLNLADYKLLPGAQEWQGVNIEKFPVFLQSAMERIKSDGDKYYIGKKK